jgi:hypothetical protein
MQKALGSLPSTGKKKVKMLNFRSYIVYHNLKKLKMSQAPVAYACNLATWEAESRRIKVQGQPGQTV